MFGKLIDSICARIREAVWAKLSGEMEAATGQPLDAATLATDSPKAIAAPKKR
jgi:hypothetical protein